MTKTLFFTFALLLLPYTAWANEANQPLAIDKTQSYLKFSGVQNKKTAFTGQFERFSPEIIFNSDDMVASFIRVEVELASVNSNNKKRDDNLKNSNWFDVENTPKALFESSSITPLEDGAYKVLGDLTIRTIKKPLELIMTISRTENIITLQGAVQLNRLDFDLGLGAWKNPNWVKHEVDVEYKVVGTLTQ
ncbi:MAG: YceI family protein [Kangiellaceae bacterium]|nr:YceI family protein [Kangiellaceae bacterium]